jgi:hypothetical protein
VHKIVVSIKVGGLNADGALNCVRECEDADIALFISLDESRMIKGAASAGF